MIANTLIAVAIGSGCIGIAFGAMLLNRYHNERTEAFAAIAKAANDEHHATAAELSVVRAELARSEAMLDAVSRECAYLRAQRSQAEALHAERIRNAIEAARWN